MLQYLLNCSAIWLLSLVVFDVFLRRESFHGYNRAYLLFTLLLGMLLPLCSWRSGSFENYPTVLRLPIERVATAKQDIIAVPVPHSTVNWAYLLIAIYMTGAVTMLCLLIVDTMKLIAFLKAGTKTQQNGWTIIETNREHSPFSFRNTLFVSAVSCYDEDQWKMILQHEERHSKLVHVADLLLMHISRIIFWFHPLVYIYYKRLLLVHEFQADAILTKHSRRYGQFLIEQALMGVAPSLTHSFNRSPIKNRLVMLTRKSSTASRGKMLLFIPVAALSLSCFSRTGLSQNFEHKGQVATRMGTRLEMSGPGTDTVTLLDPETGNEISSKIQITDPVPLKINGRKIQHMTSDNKGNWPTSVINSNQQYAAYLINNLSPLLDKLSDGRYHIGPTNSFVNEKGEIAYFELPGIYRTLLVGTPSEDTGRNGEQLVATINEKITELLEHFPKLSILEINGNAMPYNVTGFEVMVTNHHSTRL